MKPHEKTRRRAPRTRIVFMYGEMVAIETYKGYGRSELIYMTGDMEDGLPVPHDHRPHHIFDLLRIGVVKRIAGYPSIERIRVSFDRIAHYFRDLLL